VAQELTISNFTKIECMLNIKENQEGHATLITWEVVVRFDPHKKNDNFQFFICDPQDKKYDVNWITMNSCSSI
jgi:hypothetical protein